MNILTDPIWSERASPFSFAGPRRVVPPAVSFEGLPLIHATFVSHDHYDHLDNRTVRRLIQRFPSMQWLVPLGVGRFLSRRGAALVSELDWWDTLELGNISVTCTPAQHFSGRYPWNRDNTLWCGWVIRFRERSVFFAGDTALHPEFREIAARLGPFDAAILPIGAYEPRWFMQPVHMNPADATGAYCDLTNASMQQPVMVPSHWGTFRLTDEPVAEPPAAVLRAWSDAGLSTDMLWLLAHGETRSLA
ncbi:MAG: MBL fold metallo-hydrolase [Gemmatimonadaceae bacterium]|nr:MBL fold metallo-hydrolase [Gemmatimonadaceae bacterium]